ncbi:signal peptide peptidase SppA [Thermaurantiacus sp.]
MAFLGTVWKILVGVKDALVLLALLLFFAALWSALSLRAPSIQVPEGAALVIDLEGSLVDQATPISPVAGLLGTGLIRETEVDDVIRAIDLAASDRSIRALVLDLEAFTGGGLANLEAVGRAIGRFRATDKPVFAYATAYIDDSWYLAAHASEAWVNPMGGVLLAGPGGKGLYLKGALDRLKVDVEVFRVGTFKSAVEPFTREKASPEAKAADQALADDLWAAYRAGIARARPGLDVAAAVGTMPARVKGLNADLATLAKDMGFVDRIGSRLAFVARVREVVGEGPEGARTDTVNGIGLADYLRARRGRSTTGEPVGVIHVAGPIVDGEGQPGQAGSETVADLIQEAVADESVKAIVLRVDSPGGSATASEEIADALAAAKAKGKPVVASLGPVAASGGYWVSLAADRVLAEPSTITGSIGVFGIVPTFGRTLASFGITTDGVATTPYSGQPDLVAGLNDPARDLIQASVNDVYRRFIARVARARKLSEAAVEEVAEGRVWSGARALALRLVDRHGGLDAAVREAAGLARLGEDAGYRFIRTPRPWFEELLLSSGMVRFDRHEPSRALVSAARSGLASAIGTLGVVFDGPVVQAVCLACAAYRPAQAQGDRDRWPSLARLAG